MNDALFGRVVMALLVLVVIVVALVLFKVVTTPRFETKTISGHTCIVYHAGYRGGLSCDWKP